MNDRADKGVNVMKKTEGYVLKKIEDEYVLLPTGELAEQINEVISLSETAGFMYIHADEVDTTEQLAQLVSDEYGVAVSEVLDDVWTVVDTLIRKGVLC